MPERRRTRVDRPPPTKWGFAVYIRSKDALPADDVRLAGKDLPEMEPDITESSQDHRQWRAYLLQVERRTEKHFLQIMSTLDEVRGILRELQYSQALFAHRLTALERRVDRLEAR